MGRLEVGTGVRGGTWVPERGNRVAGEGWEGLVQGTAGWRRRRGETRLGYWGAEVGHEVPRVGDWGVSGLAGA